MVCSNGYDCTAEKCTSLQSTSLRTSVRIGLGGGTVFVIVPLGILTFLCCCFVPFLYFKRQKRRNERHLAITMAGQQQPQSQPFHAHPAPSDPQNYSSAPMSSNRNPDARPVSEKVQFPRASLRESSSTRLGGALPHLPSNASWENFGKVYATALWIL
jgi:hypothetical protein